MAQKTEAYKNDAPLQLVTFHMGEAICGLDIGQVWDVIKHPEMTPVPLAPDYVVGILNLRGQIVTVIDLGKRVGLSPTRWGDQSRSIVVGFDDERIGLLVDRVGDVVVGDAAQTEPPPANLGGVQGRFFAGVLKTDASLVGVLDLEEVLREEV